MHIRRRLSRGLWLLVVFALGVSFIGRALAMRSGVAAAMAQAARHASTGGAHRMPMGPAAKHEPMPCPSHDAQCCAPCLACCAACASVPVPVDQRAAGALPAAARVPDVVAWSSPAPRTPGRHLLPPPIGPPSPLVS